MQEAGINTKTHLEQIGLTIDSFDRLYSLRELLMESPPINLTEDEKIEIANIVIGVYKTRLFDEWNEFDREESGLNSIHPFSLSGDFFQKPPLAPIQFPPISDEEKPEYLFDPKAFKEWKRSLESRERIMEANHNGLQKAISDTEGVFLIPTRDAIIKHIAADEEISIEATKDFITRELLIDAEMQCCSPTTRVTQAIEALQILLWGTYNRILTDEPSIQQLSLEAPDFEEEWKWIGSYETWRAAMFVQLYPENILLPSLKPTQSEEYRVGLKSLNNSRNKRDVNQVYTAYFEYLDDIKNADILANCRTQFAGVLTNYKTNYLQNKKCLFSFAKGNKTKSFYFRETHILNSDSSISDQSEWMRIPIEIKGEFVGVQSCDIGGEHIIYFFTVEENELMLSIYDYRDNKWGENVKVDFENTQSGVKLDLEYKTYFIDMDYNPRKRPFIFIYGYDWFNFNNITDYNNSSDKSNFTFEGFVMNKKGSADNVLYNKDRFFVGYNKTNNKTYELGDRKLKDDYVNVTPKYIYYEDSNWEDYSNETLYKGNYAAGALVVVGYNEKENKFCKIKLFWWDLDIPLLKFPSINLNKSNLNSLTPKLIKHGNRIRNIVLEDSFFKTKRAFVVDNPYNNEDMPDDSTAEYEYWGSSNNVKINAQFGNYQVNQIATDFFVTDVAKESILLLEKKDTNEQISKYSIGDVNSIPTVSYQSSTDIKDIPLTNEYYFSNGGVKIDYENLKISSFNLRLAAIDKSRNYFIPIQEAFYYLPLAIANQLVHLKEFVEAKKYLSVIYDFEKNTPIYYAFQDSNNDLLTINKDWSDNPLNPHDIASTRPGTLKRSFYIQLINYFLSYANHEFTQDTVESIAKARQLYLEARELIVILKGDVKDCNAQIAEFEITINSYYVKEYWERIKTYLYSIDSSTSIDVLLASITATWNGGEPELVKIQQIESDVLAAVNVGSSNSMNTELIEMDQRLIAASNLIVAPQKNAKESKSKVIALGNEFSTAVLQTTGFAESTIESQMVNLSFLEVKNAPLPTQQGREDFFEEILMVDVVNQNVNDSYAAQAQLKPEKILKLNFQKKSFGALSPFKFCVAPNPIIRAFELQVQLNLYKIRNCMNISGIQRSLEPFAAPTDSTSGVPMIGVDGLISSGGIPIPQASPYRFSFLMDRSKELINVGQQIENAFLSALEKLDDENYSVLRAKQDLKTAKANVKLQDLRVVEAESGIKLAEIQTERSDVQIKELQGMINAGLNTYELNMINNLYQIEIFTNLVDTLDFYSSIVRTQAQASIGTGSTNGLGMATALPILFILEGTRNTLNSSRTSLQTSNNIYQFYASQARREQEWSYQISLATQDVKIGQQQEKLAQDRLRIVNQEKFIAELQTEQSEATINYLINQQFTNAALYEYMIEVLEKAYSYFLQEATATAKLARNQLAFERQQNIPEFIQGDYWIPADASDYSSSQSEDAPDRKGITGSTRLLQDIYRLEQYANQSDQRRQQLTKTISLSNIAAFEFQQFKETGIMTFATDMNLFDRDFPGHYLRLIKRVSVSVIALVPPVDGIKATFSSLGLSRVVTGGPLFQSQSIRRSPETISLSSPTNSTGVFELNQENKLLQPFEGNGVEGFWEFRMEKAANPNVDYNAVADVLVTIEYEALNSFDYRASVVRRLNEETDYEAMLPISFKSNLPDQWFDIVNPDQAETPFSVSFDLGKNNFPVNVKDPIITNVLLYFPQAGENSKEVSISKFTFAVSTDDLQTEIGILENAISTNDARISTADANGTNINGMLGKSVGGKWSLALTDTPQLRQLIDDEMLTDILLVITFAGETPKYSL